MPTPKTIKAFLPRNVSFSCERAMTPPVIVPALWQAQCQKG
jgi:hypothetical protein